MTLRDQNLMQTAALSLGQTRRQLHWLESYIKLMVIQAAMVPSSRTVSEADRTGVN